MASFKYVICLDFEATCWEERDIDNAEIIEFGAVLLNLESGEIKSSFHEYVRPTHRPVLSEYCINLTGITQALVDTQSEFNVVYQKFVTWLEEIRVLYQLKFATPNMRNIQSGINAAVCTWTLWDLRNYLPTSCKRYGITPAPHLRACVDVRYIFEKIYPVRRPFQEALDFMNISKTGNAHSAIDDAKNLANMVSKLYHNGHRLASITYWRQEKY